MQTHLLGGCDGLLLFRDGPEAGAELVEGLPVLPGLLPPCRGRWSHLGPRSQGPMWHMPLLQTSEMVSATHQRLIVTSSLIGGIDCC